MPSINVLARAIAEAADWPVVDLERWVRRLREDGELPKGKGGRGGAGAVEATPEHAAKLLLAFAAIRNASEASTLVRELAPLKTRQWPDIVAEMNPNLRSKLMGRRSGSEEIRGSRTAIEALTALIELAAKPSGRKLIWEEVSGFWISPTSKYVEIVIKESNDFKGAGLAYEDPNRRFGEPPRKSTGRASASVFFDRNIFVSIAGCLTHGDINAFRDT